MSQVLEVLNKHINMSEEIDYKERPLDEQFTAVDIYDQEGTYFPNWFYIVDSEHDSVYLGDNTIPSAVYVKRILNGQEMAV